MPSGNPPTIGSTTGKAESKRRQRRQENKEKKGHGVIPATRPANSPSTINRVPIGHAIQSAAQRQHHFSNRNTSQMLLPLDGYSTENVASQLYSQTATLVSNPFNTLHHGIGFEFANRLISDIIRPHSFQQHRVAFPYITDQIREGGPSDMSISGATPQLQEMVRRIIEPPFRTPRNDVRLRESTSPLLGEGGTGLLYGNYVYSTTRGRGNAPEVLSSFIGPPQRRAEPAPVQSAEEPTLMLTRIQTLQQEQARPEASASQPPRAKQRKKALHMPSDGDAISPYQCLVRRQIEIFEADENDVKGTAQGRNRPIILGQVGIRCVHCGHLSSEQRARGAIYYPSTLLSTYQTAQNMANSHLVKDCRQIPKHIREDLIRIRLRENSESTNTRKSAFGGGRKYWASGLRAAGLVESPDRRLQFSDSLSD